MMAFRRKDIKKSYYYVWFLGAKESKGLRGEQYILPVLRQLVNIERRTEPCKVTIQVSNKGIKIIQNVPKQTKPNGQPTTTAIPHSTENQMINNQSNTALSKQITPQNSTVKMEQIKHFIPHHAVTCALQSEDVVCIILLLYNPLTGCPVHVHGYRCDSIETAFTLRNQLQLLIDRPENQRKFAEIESRLAAKGLISQQLLNNNHQQVVNGQKIIKNNQIINGKSDQYTSQQIPNIKSINSKSSSTTTTQLIYNQHNNDLLLVNRSKRNHHTLTSDGRSAELDDCNQSDGYSPTNDGLTGLNKSLIESKSSSGNSSGSSPPPQAPNPVVVEMYENLAQELKAKLGNPLNGPILLPPKDYDTVCRSQGKLVDELLDERACKNELVVGKAKKIVKKQLEKSDNLILDINVKEDKTKNVSKDHSKEVTKTVVVTKSTSSSSKEVQSLSAVKDVSPAKDVLKDTALKNVAKDESKNTPKNVIKKETSKVDSSTTKDVLKVNKELNNKQSNDDIKTTNPNEQFDKIQKKLNQDEQEKRLNHQQIREQQKQYELKLKNLQRKQELYEQQQLLIEQQKQVKRELSAQHKLNSSKTNHHQNSNSSKPKDSNKKTNKSDDSQPVNTETSAIIQSSGIKLIGSNLANKIKQSLLIGSNNKEKLEPQLICHKTIHDSLQSLNKLTKIDAISNDKLIMNKKQINNLMKVKNEKSITKKDNHHHDQRNLLNTNTSNSSSNLSRDLNEKLNTINSRSDSSNVSKSISSGIGSGANLNTSTHNRLKSHHNNTANSNYEDAAYLSTDEDLEDEMLIHDLSECVDEYMPTDYTYNQYLNDDDEEEEDEIIDDLDDESNNNRVVKRMVLREKLLLLESSQQTKLNKNKKSEVDGSTGERVQTSSEDDDGVNSICYDENLLPKINTAKRIKPTKSSKSIKIDQKLLDNIKNAKNLTKNSNLSSSSNQIESTSITHSTKSTKSTNNNNIQSTNQINKPIMRSETYYEMGQKRMFHNNYYFSRVTNKSPIDSQPKLFYFPNPDFKAAQQQQQFQQHQQQLMNSSSSSSNNKQQPQLIKYHLGQPIIKQQCELRRQKSTPNVNAKFNYHPMLINGKSVEKLISSDEQQQIINRKIVNLNGLAHQRTRPISMVNMMQPEHFRISHHQQDKLIDPNAMFKRVPIYY